MTRYQHIDGWRYPNGVRLAVNFTLDFDAQLFRRVLGEPALELAQGEFGGRTGIWRLLELFHRHQIGLTIFTPGRIAELYPASLREATRCGFEIANHMWEHRVPAEPDLEWDHLRKTTTALEAISGRRPVGTRSHHRRSSLVRDGYVYTSSGAADEIPYYVTDGDATVLNLPFHYALDDAMYFHFGWVASENGGQRLADCDAVHDIFVAHFERLYADGKYMNICVHDFVSGRAMRVRMLDRLITEMKGRPGVWFPTCETVARYCLEQFPRTLIMPWKDRYTTSDERTLDRVEWPNGAPCALIVTVDLSPACGPDGITPKELEAEDTEYGMHVGIRRLLDAFERHRVAATFATPAIIAETWPERVREAAARGHEVAAHGQRHEDPGRLARAEEQGRIARTTETLATIAGARPHGWYSLPRPGDRYAGGQVSPHTIDLLIDAGYEYFGNGLADDIPYYWVTDFATRRSLLSMPYYPHFDDQFFLMFPAPGKGSGLERPAPLHTNWIRELEAARAFGRCFAITIHPHLLAWGGRLGLLEDVLARATSEPRAWNATASACARWFTAAYPAATSLRLEPSIWTDHPGSLS